MKKYFDSLIDTSGAPVVAASISVYNFGTTTLASLFADAAGATTLANPLTSSSAGYFEFYAADGRYTLSISVGGYPVTTISDILLDDPTNASANVVVGGSVDNSPIGSSTPSSGAFTTLSASSSVSGTGFVNYMASPPAIGGAEPNTGKFTDLTTTGNINIASTGARITGDFSNASIANRVMLQTSTVNGATSMSVVPNGTNPQADLFAFNSSDPNNAAALVARASNTEITFRSTITGTGTFLPMTFYTGGFERVRYETNGSSIFKGAAMSAVTDYVADFQSSGETTNAGRCIWSQGSTYALALSPNSTSTIAAYAQFQWIQRSDGALQSAPLRLQYDGQVLATAPAGIGYGVGAGGTVTQATSRTTGVTINKPTGAITLVSAAGSTSWQSFTVTNSLVAATDVVLVSQKSGTDKYMMHVTNVAAGSFQITFATTGGTTTEQPVFNFALIKGATS